MQHVSFLSFISTCNSHFLFSLKVLIKWNFFNSSFVNQVLRTQLTIKEFKKRKKEKKGFDHSNAKNLVICLIFIIRTKLVTF